MSTSDELVERARAVTIAQAAAQLKLAFKRSGVEHPQPCPVKGGKDRFSFNTRKNNWHCRGCSVGGRDAIGMAAHCLGLNLNRRAEFLDACSAVTGLPLPDDAERESDAERAARMKRIADLRQKTLEEQARRQAEGDDFREREREKARGIYAAARPLANQAGTPVYHYLGRRTNVALCYLSKPVRTDWLRTGSDITYWHGQDDLGRPASLHVGPALIAPFIGPAQTLIGCHITWVELQQPPKFRPHLVDPQTGEPLPTKKMRGSKKGGLIPLAGDPAAVRWAGGEGIENGLAFAGWEGFREDTFYFAAGDLGNLSGPADPRSRFAHPELRKVDGKGKARAVMIAGPEPKPDQADDDAMWVGEHVDELVLLSDGDSEPVMTAAAMARARKRHARPGRSTIILWPRRGMDFSQMAAAANSGSMNA